MPPVPTARRPQREASLQRQVLELARRCQWQAAHFHDSRREVRRANGDRLVIGDKAATGFPDIVLCKGPRVIFAELKAEDGRLSRHQEAWLAALREVESDAAGCVLVRVWRPSDWPEIERLLFGRAEP